MEFDVVIPARYGSSRLPGKPTRAIAGKPLIQWVYECARTSSASRVLVATDNAQIMEIIRAIGGEAHLTREDHVSGTDRVAELVQSLGLPQDRIVVNLQGDEPDMPGELIDQVARTVADDDSAQVSTACHKLESKAELHDSNVVKVVCDRRGRALYFSRAAIPFARDGESRFDNALRHIGIYGFRAGFLQQYTLWSATKLEQIEQLEQLRMLENGVAIAVCHAFKMPGPGIDTEQDLEAFRNKVGDRG